MLLATIAGCATNPPPKIEPTGWKQFTTYVGDKKITYLLPEGEAYQIEGHYEVDIDFRKSLGNKGLGRAGFGIRSQGKELGIALYQLNMAELRNPLERTVGPVELCARLLDEQRNRSAQTGDFRPAESVHCQAVSVGTEKWAYEYVDDSNETMWPDSYSLCFDSKHYLRVAVMLWPSVTKDREYVAQLKKILEKIVASVRIEPAGIKPW